MKYEQEAWGELRHRVRERGADAVVPARSAKHRAELEQRQDEHKGAPAHEAEENEEVAEKKKTKKRRKHKHAPPPSPTPEPDRSRRRRRPPSTDESDGGGHKAKRRGSERGTAMVWIQVPRSSLQAK